MKGSFLLLLVVGFTVGLSQCGSNDCDNANSMLATCATQLPPSAPSTSSSSSGSLFDDMCDGASACKAACVNKFSCMQINGNDPDFTACLLSCNGK